MKRSILAGGLITIAFAFIGGCSEDCINCPPCKLQEPLPIRILIAAAENDPDRFDTMAVYFTEKNLLPAGSEVRSVQLTDSLPPLEELLQFDAVLLYTIGWPLDNDAIGNVMADYVDSGGGLVMCQWSMHCCGAGIQGRLREPGYSPFNPGPTGDIPDDRSIVFNSISFPLHPIFYGIDIRNITFPGWLQLPFPVLDQSATLMAIDNFGANAIAINSDENIIGLNAWPAYVFSSLDQYPDGARLIANSLLFVAGSLQ